jgi:hypothetical protein
MVGLDDHQASKNVKMRVVHAQFSEWFVLLDEHQQQQENSAPRSHTPGSLSP